VKTKTQEPEIFPNPSNVILIQIRTSLYCPLPNNRYNQRKSVHNKLKVMVITKTTLEITCTNYGICATVNGKTVIKAPDWGYIAHISASKEEVNRSYTRNMGKPHQRLVKMVESTTFFSFLFQ
jgi:hypothetical protein